MTIVGGVLYPNPFYLKPEEYLRDIGARGLRWSEEEVADLLAGIMNHKTGTGTHGIQ